MSSNPLCLNCAEELTLSPEGWRSSDDSLTCTTGLTPGSRHTTTLPSR